MTMSIKCHGREILDREESSIFSVVSGLQFSSQYFHTKAQAESAQIDGAISIIPVNEVLNLSDESCLFRELSDCVFLGSHIDLYIAAGQSPHAGSRLKLAFYQKDLILIVDHKSRHSRDGIFV